MNSPLNPRSSAEETLNSVIFSYYFYFHLFFKGDQMTYSRESRVVFWWAEFPISDVFKFVLDI
jgi:hypothetical protein